MAADTLRQLIDSGKSSKRLDELSSARLIGKVALHVHSAQQKAGAGKAVGPVTPNAIKLAPSGAAAFAPADTSSFGYSSPEQLSGPGDRRSDVFSLGAVLWEALTYQRLFDAMNDAAVRIAIQEREITPPAEVNANVPAELSAICMRALARNPADRYQSLKSMAVEIEEFLSEAGYEDNDEKIAQYLEQLSDVPAPGRSAGGTQPPLSPTSFARPAVGPLPPGASASQLPSILTTSPVPEAVRPSSSGAALAAALASASSPGLPTAALSSTAVGVPAAPVASDWQDNGKPAAHAAPPVVVPAPEPIPLVPMPPVLPGQTPVSNDKSTISVAVPPQVKVTTNSVPAVEAQSGDSKPAAVIVEDNPSSTSLGLTPILLREPAKVDNGTSTAQLKKPQEAPPVVAPIANAEKPSADAKIDVKKAEAKVEDKKPDANVEDKKPDAKVEEKKIDAKPAEKKKDDKKPDDKKPTRSDKKSAPPPISDKKSAPHPVAAVSLGPAPRESKGGDVLAGWGWGTDKHNAITGEAYAGDEDFHAPPDNKKTLLYVFGGGLAVAAMVTIIALVAGGSKAKKKSNRPVAAAQTTEATKPAPPPDPAPAPPPDPGSAATDQGSALAGSAADGTDPAADKAAADVAAADQAAADQAAADQAAADKAAADKAAAEQTAADTKAQEKLVAEQAAADKKAAADKLAADKKAAAEQAAADKKAAAEKLVADKKATAEEKAAEKKAAAQALAEKRSADKAAAGQKAAEKKALAAEKAAEKKAAQEKVAAERPKTTTTTTARPRPTTTTAKADTKVAKADTKTESRVDVEAAYRQGLQQFARGDTAGALASLRTSLAANPSYAPTWRGLGLVFEKMGEKEQARAAFKRYLQLAPGASDTDQIKGRLERLGS